jgi:hypothetical protein
VNQSLCLLTGALFTGLVCIYLLGLTNGVEKVLNDLKIGAQPPIQEHKQQRNQADNK